MSSPVVPDRRGQQDTGQGGQDETEHPAHLGHAVRLGPRHGDQLGVVDHRPHGHARAGTDRKKPQATATATATTTIRICWSGW